MKQYFSFAIVAIMMAAPMFFGSCGDDDLLPDDSQEQVMMEWTEPFHVKNSTVAEVKTFMASSMRGYRLVAETSTTESAKSSCAFGLLFLRSKRVHVKRQVIFSQTIFL